MRWLGHVVRMDEVRIPKQALHWEVAGFRRRPGRPRMNWRDVVKKDLQRMGWIGHEDQNPISTASGNCHSQQYNGWDSNPRPYQDLPPEATRHSTWTQHLKQHTTVAVGLCDKGKAGVQPRLQPQPVLTDFGLQPYSNT